MRFIVDKCTGPAVARWLEGEGLLVGIELDPSSSLSVLVNLLEYRGLG